ncbi:hypothetical protein LGQ02_11940 [Bacillus shivajii]|uniref:hypothetical protein n=1 Tax=Bacillus shivajii TaxID=1983719 RepID=UPI001CFB6ADA|nr:hypothetical protein [Bacillus shivajii]UCZ51581.1 hypothetical protein LGQ02_11940 [Bacillus shivajii]
MNKYFINGNTSVGHYSLLYQFWHNCDTWILTGGTPKQQGNLFQSTLQHVKQDEVEVFLDPTDAETIEGLYFPEKHLLIMGDKDPLFLSRRYVGLEDRLFDLNDCLNYTLLNNETEKLRELMDEKTEKQSKSYEFFNAGKKIHEEKEKIYLSAMDFNEADQVAEELIENLFNRPIKNENSPIHSMRFFGSASAKGPVNFIDELTLNMTNRVIIKGRSGSGKSTLMRRISHKAKEHSLSATLYPCALDPDSIDMVTIPALSFAIVDGTAPHVIDPHRKSDSVVDMFEKCIDKTVETENQDRLNEITNQYKAIMKQGTISLDAALTIENQIHKHFQNTIINDKWEKFEQHFIDGLLERLTK